MATKYTLIDIGNGGGGSSISTPVSIADGGTGSSTALSNGRFMSSQSGAIKEQAGIYIVQPSEGGAGIQAALNAASTAGGGIVQLLPGTYSVTAAIYPANGISNVWLRGSGPDTILSAATGAGFDGEQGILTFYGANVNEELATNNVSATNTSITLTTHSNASGFAAGDYVQIIGVDEGNDYNMEWNIVATDGNASSGVVALVYPIQHTMTSVVTTSWRGNKDNRVSDLTVKYLSGVAPNGLWISSSTNFTVENVKADGCDVGIYFYCGSINAKVSDSFTENSVKAGLYLTEISTGHVLRHRSVNDNTSNSASYGAIETANGGINITLDGCVIDNTEMTGMLIGAGANKSRNVKVVNCHFGYVSHNDYVLYLKNCRDFVVANNTFEKHRAGSVSIEIDQSTTQRGVISGNSFRNVYFGIRLQEGRDISIVGNTFSNITTVGVDLQSNSTSCTVAGNSFNNVTSVCVGISGLGKNTVTGNNFRDCGNLAVYLSNTTNYNLVSGNEADGTSTSDIKLEDTVTNTLVTGNNFNKGINMGAGATNYSIGNLVI